MRERSTSQTPLSVGEVSGIVKRALDNTPALHDLTVRGELSNVKFHSSGHIYFTLKDADAQLKGVMFRSAAQNLTFAPTDGMRVLVRGSVSVYPAGGSYQIYATSITADGVGALYRAYEELKAKLEAEGLFDESHKKPIPPYPTAVGVITSPTGAAIQDILNITGRRFPTARIYIYPALVQGVGCAASVTRALDELDRAGLCDVIILGRGGGSLEDLFGFNDETLARHIYAAKTPIISAVGHQTDFTISDFVADLRAPTPSAAAEMAVPLRDDLLLWVNTSRERISASVERKLSRLHDKFDLLRTRRIITAPAETLTRQKRDELRRIGDAIRAEAQKKMLSVSSAIGAHAAKIEALSPLSTLARGYSIVTKDGKCAKAATVSPNDRITVTFSDGEIDASVLAVRYAERKNS